MSVCHCVLTVALIPGKVSTTVYKYIVCYLHERFSLNGRL